MAQAHRFHYTFQDDDQIFLSRLCRNFSDARRVRSSIQSIAGNFLEQDGNFLYAMIDAGQLQEALEELDMSGYTATEG